MGKKDFGSLKSPIGNTVLNFISADPDVNQEEAKKFDTSNGRKRPGRPKLKETRSQRVTLLLKPSLDEKIRAEAAEKDISVNAFFEMLLKDHFAKYDSGE